MDLNYIYDRYDYICPFWGQYAIVRRHCFRFNKPDDFTPHGGLYGIIDIEGNEVVSPSLHFIEPFNKEGVARFCIKNGIKDDEFKWGLIRNNGEIVLRPRYFFLEWINDKQLIVYDDGNKVGSPNKYNDPECWGDEFHRLTSNSKHIIDINGEDVVKDRFFDITAVTNSGNPMLLNEPKDLLHNINVPILGYIIRTCRNNATYCVFYDEQFKNKSKEYGSIIFNGEFAIVENVGSSLNEDYSETHWHGLIDRTGVEILSVDFESLVVYNNGSLILLRKNKKIGFADRSGNIIVPCRIDEIGPEFNNKIVARIGNQYGVIDLLTGKEVLPFIYNYIDMYGNRNELRRINCNKKNGFINSNCELILPIECECLDIEKYNNALSLAKRNGKYGFLDEFGRWAILPMFDDAERFNTHSYFDKQTRSKRELHESCAEVRIFNKRMIVNKQGRVMYQEDFIDTAELSSMYIECEWKMQEDASLQSFIS